MLPIEQYIALKTQGLITLARVGDAYASAQKRFDVNTGSAGRAEVQSLDLDVYRAEVVRLRNIIVQIEALIADCLALPSVLPPSGSVLEP